MSMYLYLHLLCITRRKGKCNISEIQICEIFRCIGIPKHWRLSLVQVRNFYYLLEFFNTRRERRNFLLCWLFHLTPRRAANLVDPTGLDSPRFEISTRFVLVQMSTNCFFSKITQNPQPIASGHDVIHISSPIFLSGFFIMTSVSVTSSPHERELLRSMCAPTRTLSRIVLSLTKPKDKI